MALAAQVRGEGGSPGQGRGGQVRSGERGAAQVRGEGGRSGQGGGRRGACKLCSDTHWIYMNLQCLST